MQDHPWGWRFSLGFACVFAALFFLGTLLAPDSPNSLLLNGKTEKATEVRLPVSSSISAWHLRMPCRLPAQVMLMALGLNLDCEGLKSRNLM